MTTITHHLFVSPRNQATFVQQFGNAHKKIASQKMDTTWVIGRCERQTGHNLLKLIDSFTWDSETPLPPWQVPTLVFFSHEDKALFARHLREKSGTRLPHPSVLMDHLSFLGQGHADFVSGRTHFHTASGQSTDTRNIALWMTGMYNILENSL